MKKPVFPKPFWEYFPNLQISERDSDWATAAFQQAALATSTQAMSQYTEGAVNLDDIAAELFEKTKDFTGFNKIFEQVELLEQVHTYVWNDGYFRVRVSKGRNGTGAIAWLSVDKELACIFEEIQDKCIKPVTSSGKVYVMVQGHDGPRLHSVGAAGEELQEINYHREIIEGYRHALADIKSDSPCGRIVILDGPPGLGKTYLVKSFINDAPGSTFVFLPPGMMAHISDPSLIPALLRERERGRKIVLIIEDADECLSSRKADNIAAISTLLNFSDGIIGRLLDLRIIATTNIDIKDVDEAILRDGRLCRRLELTSLGWEQANQVYEKLTGKPGAFTSKNKYLKLCEIYKAAREGGYSPKEKERTPVGFDLSSRFSSFETELFDFEDDLIDEDP